MPMLCRLPHGEAWISSKFLHQTSVHDKLTTTVNEIDGKVKINFTDNFQYISHGCLNLVVKHVGSGLKVVFVAPSKAHKLHDKGVYSVDASVSPIVVSSCEGSKLLVWDSTTDEVIQDLKGHGGPVYKCRLIQPEIAFSCGADGATKVWSTETGNNAFTLIGHTMAVTDISIIAKGRNAITVSKDGTAKLWDVSLKNCLGNIIEPYGPINCCAIGISNKEIPVKNEREIATGNKLLVIGCENGAIKCAHVAKREELYVKQLQEPCNACIVIENSIIAGCSNGKVVQLNLQDGALIKEWHESASPVLCLASLTNHLFVVGRQDGTCTVLSLNDAHNTLRVYLTGSDCDGIRDISFNGKWIFAGCRDSYVRKYDYNQVIAYYK
ncbi:proteasomal ATPase-associated factor 1 isoform X2 [Amyelois transitella]|uniref:proteasomal ATPase-associated factor 1 isoform X2 n=1 Tax=Amyelois transitella TaxID=680683 RepID=UPI00067DB760|nr:proteasomal ATPase-associated factor 1 isoform X2 [Amyelois transitella]